MNRDGRHAGTDALATLTTGSRHSGGGNSRRHAPASIEQYSVARALSEVPVPSTAGRLARGVGEGIARSVGEGVARSAAEGARGFLRARSFASLRGFSRIGGVLIGNEPGKRPSSTFVAFPGRRHLPR